MGDSPTRRDDGLDCCTCDFIKKEYGMPSDVSAGFCPFCRMFKTDVRNQNQSRRNRDTRAETWKGRARTRSPCDAEASVSSTLTSTWSPVAFVGEKMMEPPRKSIGM